MERYSDSNRITFLDVANKSNKFYFSEINRNGLYCFDDNNKELQYLRFFPTEKTNMKYLHGKILLYKEKIFFSPMNADNFCVYDIVSNKFDTIKMNYDLIPQGLRSKFFGILYCDNKIYYIPCRSKYLAVLHLSTSEITYHKIFNSDKHEQKSKNGMFVKNAYFIKDNWLYLGMLYEDLVIRIHTNSFEVESVWTGDGKTGFADMFLDDNQVEAWLLSNIDNRIIKWNTLDNHMESYHFCNMQDIERYDYPYLNMSRLGEDIYIYSYEAGNSYKFNKTSKKAVIIDENRKVFGKDKPSQIIHLFSKRINDSLLINNAYDLSFDLYTNGEITRHITLYDNNYTNRLDLRRGLKRKNEDFISNVTINETKEFALKDFIGAVEGISEKSVNDRNEVYVCRI